MLGPQENQELREKELGKVMCMQYGGLRGGENDVIFDLLNNATYNLVN